MAEVADEAGDAAVSRSRKAGDSVGFSTNEIKLLDPLNDAVVFVAALRSGRRDPARALAEVCGISVRTAQGRVAAARKAGLLTSARHGHIEGELTPMAQELADRAVQFDLLRKGDV